MGKDPPVNWAKSQAGNTGGIPGGEVFHSNFGAKQHDPNSKAWKQLNDKVKKARGDDSGME